MGGKLFGAILRGRMTIGSTRSTCGACCTLMIGAGLLMMMGGWINGGGC